MNNTVTKFRKKPVVIEAVQFKSDGSSNVVAIQDFIGKQITPEYEQNKTWLNIETPEGVMRATLGDWIIKGVNGEFYPCKPDIFEKTYEPPTPASEGREVDGYVPRKLIDELVAIRNRVMSVFPKGSLDTDEVASRIKWVINDFDTLLNRIATQPASPIIGDNVIEKLIYVFNGLDGITFTNGDVITLIKSLPVTQPVKPEREGGVCEQDS